MLARNFTVVCLITALFAVGVARIVAADADSRPIGSISPTSLCGPTSAICGATGGAFPAHRG